MAGCPRFPREWTWPGGHRVAVTVGVPFEAFINQSQFSYIGTPGKKDNFSLSYGDYAWKAGIWRMLNVLDEFGVKASMSTNGLAAERHPEIVRMCAGEGHEANGHGWAADAHPDYRPHALLHLRARGSVPPAQVRHRRMGAPAPRDLTGAHPPS